MAEPMSRLLVIMAKEPRLGMVKSRLARDIGWVRATAFQRQTTFQLLWRLGADHRWRALIAVAPDSALASSRWPAWIERCCQGPGDLGARMGRLMALMPPGRVVIVGSDIPGIKPSHIARAFERLGSHDAVIGPAGDGGYWLIGLRRTPRLIDAFGGVTWSSPQTLADTLSALRKARVALVDKLSDVDDGKEYRRQQGVLGRLVF